MGLFQNLLQTYEKCKDAIGIVRIGNNGEINERKTFLPIFHTLFKSHICITLDGSGNFLDARRDNKELPIIIPCTDSSAGRSSGVAAHPLCDQLDYVSGLNDEKLNGYLNQLKKWHDAAFGAAKLKLSAIYEYVSKKTMLADLTEKQIFRNTELNEDSDDKTPNKEKIRKLGIRFRIELQDDLSPNVWEDKKLRESWADFTNFCMQSQSGEIFDYLSGKPLECIAAQHPKNINPATGNAKLLSCNDSSGLTFRGRFADKDEAVIIDYAQSQRMHQTLRWLINNYGHNTDTQTIVIWSIDSDIEPPVIPYRDSFNIFSSLKSDKTEAEMLLLAETEVYADYSKKLKQYLQGYGKTESITTHLRKICIAIFDAATTGRMGLTFYQELSENDYLESIVNWHNETSYFLRTWLKESSDSGKEITKRFEYIGAPSFDDIMFATYGKPKGGKEDDSYKLLKKNFRKQLLECMFGNFSLPKNLIETAVSRASQPLIFIDKNNSFVPNDWDRAVRISCALIRKYYKKEKNKEEISMELEEQRRDRDYLYGRLLAIADRLEQTALFKADKSNQRVTNALRLMNAFSIKPHHTWGIIYNQILPYRIQLSGAGYYQTKIDEVMELFKSGDFEDNSPLSPLYLLGYSAQNRALIKSNKKGQEEDNKNDE